MKRISSVFVLSTSLAAAALALGCNFTAGVGKGDTGAAGTSGGAGTQGGAGTLGPTGASGSGNPFTGTGGMGGSSAFPPKPCEGLQCAQSTCRGEKCTTVCQGGARTTVSGTIYDPAGNVPLYNIAVYVPNKALDPISDGPSCDMCDPITGTSRLSGSPVTLAKSGTDGSFKLGIADNLWGDVPAGTDIPLVIQVGKWRREVKIPTVTPCVDNAIMDKNLTRLPRNSTEGHIPKMAITTGEKDALQCLLLKVGVDQSEFTPAEGTGRINLYAGGGGAMAYDTTLNAGAAFPAANTWWESVDNLNKYDIILHSCDGGQGDYNVATGKEPMYAKSMAARMALEQWANKGGRVFASHWHSYWFAAGSETMKSIATWGVTNGRLPPMATVDQSFPTGVALAEWLVKVGGSVTPGIVDITQDATGRLISAAAGGKTSQRWLYSAGATPESVSFLSATTPIPGGTCGRAVVSDLHLASGGMTGDNPTATFPTSCVTKTLEPREKVLEFMLFDIASCVKPVIE